MASRNNKKNSKINNPKVKKVKRGAQKDDMSTFRIQSNPDLKMEKNRNYQGQIGNLKRTTTAQPGIAQTVLGKIVTIPQNANGRFQVPTPKSNQAPPSRSQGNSKQDFAYSGYANGYGNWQRLPPKTTRIPSENIAKTTRKPKVIKTTTPSVRTPENRGTQGHFEDEAWFQGFSYKHKYEAHNEADKHDLTNTVLPLITSTTVNYDGISTSPPPVITTTTTMKPSPFLDPDFANYAKIGFAFALAATIGAVSIYTIISVTRVLMGCCPAPVRRFRDWLLGKIGKKRQTSEISIDTSPTVETAPSPVEQKGLVAWFRKTFFAKEPQLPVIKLDNTLVVPTDEAVRLLGNNDNPSQITSITGLEKEMDALKAVGKEEIKNPTKNSKEQQKKDEDAAVSDYEDSLKPTAEENEHSKKQDERIKKLKDDVKKSENIHERRKSQTLSAASAFSETDEINRKFYEDLAEQDRKFTEEMEERRRKRREKQRLADAELRELRYKSQQAVAALLACIQLKQRFKDEEEKWSNNLKAFRDPLIVVKNSYYDLQDEITKADFTDEFDVSCVDSEGKLFAQKVQNAQFLLSQAFNYLENLSEDYEDRIFIRMIMKSVSEQGHICDQIGEELVKTMKEKSKNMKDLDQVMFQLDSHAIPTTSELTRKSTSVNNEDYMGIKCVPYQYWFRYFE